MAYWAPACVACCNSVWRSDEEAKIHYVDAHHDEQRRDYGKFNQGIARYSICSDHERADSLPSSQTSFSSK